jgi:hypothetical protein
LVAWWATLRFEPTLIWNDRCQVSHSGLFAFFTFSHVLHVLEISGERRSLRRRVKLIFVGYTGDPVQSLHDRFSSGEIAVYRQEFGTTLSLSYGWDASFSDRAHAAPLFPPCLLFTLIMVEFDFYLVLLFFVSFQSQCDVLDLWILW